MKAAFRSKYGSPNKVLSIKEIDLPVPKDDEVLIRVHASTANRTDYHVLTGTPFIMRIFLGLFRPRSPRIGSDFAGQVEATGKDVKDIKVGDKVMGFGGVFGKGTLAQQVAFPERGIVPIPANLNYEQAVTCLEGAYYAIAGLLHMKPAAGQKALVYGATGAIGSSQLQFLKYFGLYVTAVCGTEHIELVRSLGADRIIDFKTQDFTKDEERYDFVFDAVDKASFLRCKKLLKKKGIYTSSGGFINLFWAFITRVTGGKRVLFIPPKDIRGGLSFIRDLVEKGHFQPVIDRKYPLDKIAEAFSYVGTGQKTGTVVITMDVV